MCPNVSSPDNGSIVLLPPLLDDLATKKLKLCSGSQAAETVSAKQITSMHMNETVMQFTLRLRFYISLDTE